jgi:hypothetical protein
MRSGSAAQTNGLACGCARMRGAGSRNSVCGSEREVHARRRGWPVARENQKARPMAFATKSGSAPVVALRLNERPKRGDALDRSDNGDGVAVCRWARCSGSGRRIACDLCRFAASAVTRMIRTRYPMFLRAVAIRHHPFPCGPRHSPRCCAPRVPRVIVHDTPV